jgi:pSer/pThr/pTyr-binding forkhead associated (FHA) protein
MEQQDLTTTCITAATWIQAALVPVLQGIEANVPGARRLDSTLTDYLAPQGSEVPLSMTGAFTVGRQQGSSLLLNSPDVSRHHATITYNGEKFLLCDFGSTNGTFLNEERLEAHSPRALNPGDKIRFATMGGIFLLQVGPPSRPAEEVTSHNVR